MRKKRDPETEEHRNERLENEALKRIGDAAVEDTAMDAMVKQSILMHGP